MIRRRHACLTLLALLFFAATVLAASPASFCKCTCFSQSYIIQLNGLPSTSKIGAASNSKDVSNNFFSRRKGKSKERTCNDCNKQFCLDYNLCHGATEQDVFSECFQRDSAKDQVIVLIFIIATVGLLVYAAVRPYVDRWSEKTKERRTYMPVSGEGDP